ncbi:hypothetical protein JTE90_010065 [Oedothorax gibbosus]|uniref:EGF-like domain-containing protein n=1 Tax=Oedothorax gibbosus TaxID=931172 RepID=A0AAV6UXD4_9ARAC|nr:hypothetical protein JTE90_010065 [Oedothorax gibbosus]
MNTLTTQLMREMTNGKLLCVTCVVGSKVHHERHNDIANTEEKDESHQRHLYKIFNFLSSHSYCDKENICRCKPDYPVNISLHSCKKGKYYSEKCEYSEECLHFDPNSYCTQLPYRSTCECHNGFVFNEVSKLCEKFDKGSSKPSNHVFPTAIGGSIAFASIIFFVLITWQVCKRQNIYDRVFARRNIPERSHYLPTSQESQRTLPTAPIMDETLPTYDTALSQKISEDCEPPPSYEEVIAHVPVSKT